MCDRDTAFDRSRIGILNSETYLPRSKRCRRVCVIHILIKKAIIFRFTLNLSGYNNIVYTIVYNYY